MKVDPSVVAAGFAALDGIVKIISSFDEESLTSEQLAKRRAIEDASRADFDAYVAKLPPKD